MMGTMFKGMKSLGVGFLLSSTSYGIYCQTREQHEAKLKKQRENPAYKRLLDGNRDFVEARTAEDPDFFKNLAKGQSPKYLVIGCADSRVPLNKLTNTGFGELFIHRNVANLVNPTDFNINSVLQFAIEVLKVKHIIVMGHTQCGGVKASMDGQFHGMIDQWLNPIREVFHKHSKELDSIKDEDLKLRKLTEYTIKEQVLTLCKNQFVQKAWARKQPLDVHGWICEVETGKVIDLDISEEEWTDIKHYFRLHYSDKQLEQN